MVLAGTPEPHDDTPGGDSYGDNRFGDNTPYLDLITREQIRE